MRIPRYGRDIRYDKRSAEALIPSVGVNENKLGEVFRLNLELGRFMRSYEIDVGGDDGGSVGGGALQGGIGAGAVNTAAIAEDSHNLLAFGTTLGTVEFWDPRSRDRVGILQGFSPDHLDGRQEMTALAFHGSGLNLAAGSSGGLIQLYDLRSPIPLLKKDHGYGYPIRDLIYLTPTKESRIQSNLPLVLAADKRIIKLFDARDGTPWTSVEPSVDLNSVAWCKDSGMLLTANEGRQQHSFFIPQLGPAPKWCAFLDNLVEEMAEDPNDPSAFTNQQVGEVYDNYKFLTVPQLEALNLSHLVGTTTLLRPYMHGYFVAQRLYEEAKVIADPFVWEEQRARRVKEKIETERESRIRGNKKVTAKVNKRLAEKILEKSDRDERNLARRVLEQGGDEPKEADEPAVHASKPKGLLSDPRFAKLFQDEDFTIDENSREYQQLNPSTKPTQTENRERKLTAVEQEMEDDVPVHSSDESESESEQEDAGPRSNNRISSNSYKRSGHRPQQPRMQVTSSKEVRSGRDRSFGSRKPQDKKERRRSGAIVGERQITFNPEKKKQALVFERPAARKDKAARRSASGNVFRNL